MILSSLKAGLAAVKANKRLVVVFFLANLFFGLLLMLPLRAVLQSFVGFSSMGAELAGRLNMDFLFEFLKQNRAVNATFGGLVLIVPAAYWLLSLFLSGGAFAVFASGETYRPSFFWGSAAKYFGRFFRLLLWSLPVFALLFSLQFLETGIQRLLFGSDPYQYITYWGTWIKTGFAYVGIILFGMVLDYARIHAVLTDEHKMRKSLWQGIKFSFAFFVKTFGLALLVIIAGGVVLWIYNLIANSLSAPNVLIIILLVIVQQLYMIFRMILRLTLYSSQMHLYNALSGTKETVQDVTGEDLGLEGAPA